VRVAVGNIPHSLSVKDAHHDCRRLAALAADGVVLACEIDSSNDVPFVHAAAERGKRSLFNQRKTQVAIPRTWHNVHAHRYQLTTAIPGLNPARDLNVAFDYDTRTAYASAHMTNGKRNPTKARSALRWRKWLNYERRAASLVAHWHEGGWNVVIGGDLNDPRGADFHPKQVKLAHSGLMWLIAIPAPGQRVKRDDHFVDHTNRGDHPLIAADFTFEEN
jgi:hypothetical protein